MEMYKYYCERVNEKLAKKEIGFPLRGAVWHRLAPPVFESEIPIFEIPAATQRPASGRFESLYRNVFFPVFFPLRRLCGLFWSFRPSR